MAIIPLEVREVSFLSDQGVVVSAFRVWANARFLAQDGSRVAYPALFDSGAPFSVLPYSLWHDRGLRWQWLGSQLTRQGQRDANALDWFGVPCDLGAAQAYLVDSGSGQIKGRYLVIAKFARARHPDPHVESSAVLGLSFLTDNRHLLFLDGTGGTLSGKVRVP